MKKRLAVCAAAALAASLTLGSLSTAYAATEMTLAGFGAEVKKEDTKAETEKKEEAQPKETEAKKAETEPKETEVKKAETEPKETEAKKAETEAVQENASETPAESKE